MTVRYNLSDVKLSNLLCFFSLAEAHGLVYPHPSLEISVLHDLYSLPDDGRSISQNDANINKLVEDKTVLSEHSTTERNIPIEFG